MKFKNSIIIGICLSCGLIASDALMASSADAVTAAEKSRQQIIIRLAANSSLNSESKQTKLATNRSMPIPGIRYLKSIGPSLSTSNSIISNSKTANSMRPSGELIVVEMIDPKADRSALIKQLIASDDVVYAEPDYLLSTTLTPDDTNFTTQWGLNNTGQSNGTADADIDAVEAWDITTGSDSIVVGVVDTGVQYDHPDIVDNMWRNPGETGNGKESNGIDDDSNGYVDDVYGIDCINDDGDPYDDNGGSSTSANDDVYHGTHVAGILGAQGNNDNQTTGVNWNVSIMALKYLGVDGRGVTSDAIECLMYVANMKKNYAVNIRVTNNSYGGGDESQFMREAIQTTLDEDILFVAASGNDGVDNDITPHFPSSYDMDGVISVASTDRRDRKAGSSNYGLVSVDLGAPGVSILSLGNAGSVNTLSGTSMASPQVAGVAALLLADDPSLSVAQLKYRVLDTADANSELHNRTVAGARLNAHAALSCSNGPENLYLKPISLSGYLKLDQATALELRLTTCGDPVTGATVSMAPSNSQAAISLLDNGIAPDKVANDGLYTANWIPTLVGPVSLALSATTATSNFAVSEDVTVIDVPDYSIDPTYPYAWAESSDGNDVGLGNVDDAGAAVDIGFDFNFYGINYSQVYAHSNGMLKFGADVELSFFEFLDLPSVVVPNNFIAVFWEDLNPAVNDGAIYSKLEGAAPNRRLIVQWENLLHFRQVSEDLPSTVTVQAILYEGSNDIVLQYKDLTFGDPVYDFGARAMIGIELFDGSEGLSYLNQGLPAETSLSEEQAILFSQDQNTLRTLTVQATAQGSVTADQGQINCAANGNECFGQFSLGSNVNLVATPIAGYRFEAWNGPACEAQQSASCSLVLDGHKSVQAIFGLNPEIVVSPEGALVTDESGATATFTVALNRPANSDVSIGLSSSDESEGIVSPNSLTFTPSDGTSSKTVSVTGINDDIDDGNIAYSVVIDAAESLDENFSGLDPNDVLLINNDDADTAGMTITASAPLDTNEGGSNALFSIVLDSEPLNPVEIIILSTNTNEGTLSHSSVSFDSSNWNQSQSVMLSGVDDLVDDGDISYQVDLTVTASSDPAYRTLSIPSLSAINRDDDLGSIVVVANQRDTSEGGDMQEFTIALASQPQSPVSIALSSSNIEEGTVSPAIISFDSSDWNLAQSIKVTGVDDFIVDGTIDYVVQLAPSLSDDPDYSGLDADDLEFSNLDNDVAEILLSITTLETSEAGASATISVELSSQPSHLVSVDFTSSNQLEATTSASSLSFTPNQWNIAQSITIVGVDDDVDDGDISYQITIAPAQSNDADYADFELDDLSLINLDDDTAGITVSAGVLQTNEMGSQASFMVALDSQPTANVSLSISGQPETEISLSSQVLNFSASNALETQTVFITGLADSVVDGDQNFTVVIGAAISEDLLYAGLDASDLVGTNIDVDGDADQDNIIDGLDNCPNTSNPDQLNSDQDLNGGDVCDDDDDNDGRLDIDDNCRLDSNSDQLDTDSDLIGDVCDSDSDNDSVLDEFDQDALNPYLCEDLDEDSCDDCSLGADGFGELADNFPFNDGPDLDGDGVCDLSDTDLDGDDIPNEDDNCPEVTNDDQNDNNGDGIGDACSVADADLCLPIKTASGQIAIVCL